VGAPPGRSARGFRWLLELAGLALAAVAAAESSAPLPPAAIGALSIPFFVDRQLGDGLRESLVEAARRLSDSRCQDILGDFTDESGRTLRANLHDLGQSMPGYLGLVLFYDGSTTEPCADERVLAWTSPGGRAVRVCPRQFAYWQRVNPGYAASIVIHEALHTLGLGESPPAPAAITARVIERCGR
jgi:hypothetical protein